MAKDKEPNIPNFNKKEKELFLKAFYKQRGHLANAVKAANVGRTTVHDWRKSDEEFNQAYQDVKEALVDLSESKLLERIVGYSHPEDKIFIDKGEPIIVPTIKHYPPDTTAIIFHLKTQGKDRGYIERQDVNLSGNINTTKVVKPSYDEE